MEYTVKYGALPCQLSFLLCVDLSYDIAKPLIIALRELGPYCAEYRSSLQ